MQINLFPGVSLLYSFPSVLASRVSRCFSNVNGMASESASIWTVGNRHSNCSNTIKASSCIVIAIARAGFKGRTSLIYCLNYTHDGLKGDPFRLHDRKGLYIWQNNAIRLERIRNGSVLKYLKSGSKFLYQENTNEVEDFLFTFEYASL